MRVFVTGTGRCGTTTFSKACSRITNFTSGHETRWGPKGDSSLAFPDNHIEVDPHLFWRAPELLWEFPDAKWVLLVRKKEGCVRSLMKTAGIHDWIKLAYGRPVDLEEACGAYYDSVNHWMAPMMANVDGITMHLERLSTQWYDFWEWIGAEGDFDASVAELSVRYNAR